MSKIRKIDGGLLLVFRELLRCRNATEAARRLHLSPSAVTHSLNRLRELFGDQLFVRRSHGFEPTRKAREIGPRIESLIELTSEVLTDQGGFEPKKTQRRFSIGAPEFLTALIGAPLIRRLRDHAPGASIDILHLSRDRAIESMRRGEIDLALGRFGNLDDSRFEARTLYAERYCVVARRGHPHVRGRLTERQYVGIGHVFASAQSEGGPGERIPPPSTMATVAIVPHWLTALMIVARTDLLGSVPERLARSQAQALGLQVIKAPYPNESWIVSAVRLADRQDSGVDWLLRMIEACI